MRVSCSVCCCKEFGEKTQKERENKLKLQQEEAERRDQTHKLCDKIFAEVEQARVLEQKIHDTIVQPLVRSVHAVYNEDAEEKRKTVARNLEDRLVVLQPEVDAALGGRLPWWKNMNVDALDKVPSGQGRADSCWVFVDMSPRCPNFEDVAEVVLAAPVCNIVAILPQVPSGEFEQCDMEYEWQKALRTSLRNKTFSQQRVTMLRGTAKKPATSATVMLYAEKTLTTAAAGAGEGGSKKAKKYVSNKTAVMESDFAAFPTFEVKAKNPEVGYADPDSSTKTVPHGKLAPNQRLLQRGPHWWQELALACFRKTGDRGQRCLLPTDDHLELFFPLAGLGDSVLGVVDALKQMQLKNWTVVMSDQNAAWLAQGASHVKQELRRQLETEAGDSNRSLGLVADAVAAIQRNVAEIGDSMEYLTIVPSKDALKVLEGLASDPTTSLAQLQVMDCSVPSREFLLKGGTYDSSVLTASFFEDLSAGLQVFDSSAQGKKKKKDAQGHAQCLAKEPALAKKKSDAQGHAQCPARNAQGHAQCLEPHGDEPLSASEDGEQMAEAEAGLEFLFLVDGTQTWNQKWGTVRMEKGMVYVDVASTAAEIKVKSGDVVATFVCEGCRVSRKASEPCVPLQLAPQDLVLETGTDAPTKIESYVNGLIAVESLDPDDYKNLTKELPTLEIDPETAPLKLTRVDKKKKRWVCFSTQCAMVWHLMQADLDHMKWLCIVKYNAEKKCVQIVGFGMATQLQYLDWLFLDEQIL